MSVGAVSNITIVVIYLHNYFHKFLLHGVVYFPQYCPLLYHLTLPRYCLSTFGRRTFSIENPPWWYR